MQEAIGSNPIFSTRAANRHPIFDIVYTDKQAGKSGVRDKRRREMRGAATLLAVRSEEVKKGAWWMPRLKEAMKDVGSCENLRLGATGH